MGGRLRRCNSSSTGLGIVLRQAQYVLRQAQYRSSAGSELFLAAAAAEQRTQRNTISKSLRLKLFVLKNSLFRVHRGSHSEFTEEFLAAAATERRTQRNTNTTFCNSEFTEEFLAAAATERRTQRNTKCRGA